MTSCAVMRPSTDVVRLRGVAWVLVSKQPGGDVPAEAPVSTPKPFKLAARSPRYNCGLFVGKRRIANLSRVVCTLCDRCLILRQFATTDLNYLKAFLPDVSREAKLRIGDFIQPPCRTSYHRPVSV